MVEHIGRDMDGHFNMHHTFFFFFQKPTTSSLLVMRQNSKAGCYDRIEAISRVISTVDIIEKIKFKVNVMHFKSLHCTIVSL